MSQGYSAYRLYQDTFNIKYDWEKWLPENIYRYHSLICQEVDSPVELQMGILLPFIASVCGPTTRSVFLTRPSVINLFWINVVASGGGKSQARTRLIREPLMHIIQNSEHQVGNFETSQFTRAGKYMFKSPYIDLEPD